MTAPTPAPAAGSGATGLKVALGVLVAAGIALAVLLGVKLVGDDDTADGGGETFTSAPEETSSTTVEQEEETTTTTTAPSGPTEIVLRANQMEISQGGGDVRTFVDYTRAADDAIDALTDALGAPTRTLSDPGDDICFPPTEIVEWPALSLQHATNPEAPDGFIILSGDVPDGSEEEAFVTTDGGTRLGDSLDAVLAAAPDAITSTNAYEGTEYTNVLVDAAEIYDRGPYEDPNGVGVVVYTQDGVVTGITAPMYLIDEC